jgi:hypothetical protein
MCSTQNYESCEYPCIASKSESESESESENKNKNKNKNDNNNEDKCIYDVCAKYETNNCLTQTDDICDLINDGNNNKCVTHIISGYCENKYKYEI